MFIRKYWIPITVFLVVIVGVGLYYLQTRPPKDPIVIIKPVEPLPKSEVKAPVGDTAQGGHFHADGTWHEGPHEAPVKPPSTDVGETPAPVANPTPTGTLTYHTELLDRHPVEALRQQAKERGHWSADHIPPFPPDDQEAAVFARDLYIMRHYKHTGQFDHPEYLRAFKAQRDFFRALRRADDAGFDTPWEYARNCDLLKLTWTMIPPLGPTRWATTFTVADGINLESSRELLPLELEMSLR